MRKAVVARADVCKQCCQRPCLGALSRCSECIRAAAEVDRESRRTAETRVASKKSAREAVEARAAAEHQAALEKLGQLYIEFAASPEGVRFLEAQQAELTAPRNDPEYVKAALARDKEREVASNEVRIVHHVVEWGKSYIALTLRDERNHAKAREVSAILQRLFEAEHRYHEDPRDQPRSADRTLAQPAKHSFGRTKRSLPHRDNDGLAETRTKAGRRR